jgi:geranylgeranyl diphosphate synthase type II
MIHTYSLIHDDLPAMDNDDFRRGKNSLHKQFNEALAILTGDALLTDSFKYFASENIDSDLRSKLVMHAALCAGSNGMVKGQVLDMDANNKSLSLDEIKEIHLHKTKDLIYLSIICAKEISRLDDSYLEKLESLSMSFGLAFQIKDDIDDFYNEKDLVDDKATYVKVVGIDDSTRLLEDYKIKTLEITEEIFGVKKLYQLIKEVLK